MSIPHRQLFKKTMRTPRQPTSIVPPLIMLLGLTATYLATMAPGLTWANGGSDGGDLIAATATNGVAHPTGYPVYMCIARLFQLLPFGSLAFRTNLLSAVASVATAGLIYTIVKSNLWASCPKESAWGGMVAGIAYGLSPLAWSQSVITEVYSLHVCLVSLVLFLSLLPDHVYPLRNKILGLTLGVAVGNHVLAVLMVPGVFLAIVLKRLSNFGEKIFVWKGWKWDGQAFIDLLLGLGTGLLFYLILPFRAWSHPPVNWGDPITIGRFLWLVSGDLYQGNFFQFNLPMLWSHLQSWAYLTVLQFGVVGLVIGLIGLVIFFVPSRLHFITLWTFFTFTIFSIQYTVVDSAVYLMPAFLAFSIWIGLGVGQMMKFFSRPLPRIQNWIGLAGLMYLVVFAAGHWSQVDASQDKRAESFGNEVMTSVPAGAIVFTSGDRNVFSLWYFHYALHQRSDIAVIANDLLPFDWYRENLKYSYPGLRIPATTQDTWPSVIVRVNPDHHICFITSPEPNLNCK